MKAISLFLLPVSILLGNPATSSAQSWAVRLDAGANFATHYRAVGLSTWREDPTLGLTLESPLARALAFQVGLRYVVKGYGDSGSGLRQQAVELPVAVRFDRRSRAFARPTFMLGVAVGWELACHAEQGGGTVGGTTAPTLRLTPADCNLRRNDKSDVGIVAGAGVELGHGKAIPIFELRYTHGMLRILSLGRYPFTNRNVSMTAGLRIGL